MRLLAEVLRNRAQGLGSWSLWLPQCQDSSSVGSRIGSRGDDGETALLEACQHNNHDVVKTLLGANADIDVRDCLDHTG